jgi:dinuclear metal center YbgI/SA1388 family protein
LKTVADIMDAVDRLAPFRAAEAWDNVGLLLGDAAWPARRVLVCLDVSEAVCREAARRRAGLVLAHHPLLFKDVDRLTIETRHGRLALALLASRRALIAAHTNLDGAEGGLCDILAGMVGLGDLEPLRAEPAGKHYKVVVFTPPQVLEAVRAAAFDAGAGRIGNYAECAFAAEGQGTFRPGDGSKPAVGRRGRRSSVRELRLEFLADDRRLGGVLAAVARAHPYEEPAVDVYPLHAAPGRTGLGRIGCLVRPTSAGRFAETLRKALGLRHIALAGPPGRKVRRVAVVTGAGSGLVDSVLAAGADAFLTGELKFHEIEDLAAAGLAVVLGGHYRTERVPLERWAPRLARELKGVEVRMSRSEREALELK